MYAIIMSALNFGNMLAFQFGGLLMHILGITENNFKNLWILLLISNLSMITLLPFLKYVQFKTENLENDNVKENAKDNYKENFKENSKN